MDIYKDALKVMGIGVGGVFLVLAIFYILVKLMMKIFPEE
ncbi:MAG TPA: OadG-related small transporter subunit [Bacillota bacterium]|nr:OadG-related small transporter subunit [Bacillota bacterium]